MLKMLLPTTLPTAMSRSPLIVASTDVASSGSDVPAATIVRPITSSESPKLSAISTALSTIQFEPTTRSTRPPRT